MRSFIVGSCPRWARVCVAPLLSCGASLVQPQYLNLEQLCEEFAVELLGMCRNQSEVTTILNSSGDESQDCLDEQAFDEGIPNLSRLRLAVNYNQKQVARHCRRDVRRGHKTDPWFLSVCGPPNLPAGAVIYLVWKPGRLERQQDGLEAVRFCGHLSHHASPLPLLLDSTKVKGEVSRGLHKFCLSHLLFFYAGRKDTKDSRHQVYPSLSLLFVVSHHITGRINNNGDVSRRFFLAGAEHPADLAPHGVGGR